MFRRRWGFLVLAFASTLGVVGPWILKLLGLEKYPYERADVVETVILIALSFLALRGFVSASRHEGRRANFLFRLPRSRQ